MAPDVEAVKINTCEKKIHVKKKKEKSCVGKNMNEGPRKLHSGRNICKSYYRERVDFLNGLKSSYKSVSKRPNSAKDVNRKRKKNGFQTY